MVTPTANCTWIKDHLKVSPNVIAEALAYQGVFVNELSDFNDEGQKSVCSTAINHVGVDRWVNFSSIVEARLAIAIRSAKYYEDLGRPIEPNVMEWSRIKHIKSVIQIQYNWINPYPLPEFSCAMYIMKFLELIHNNLRNKLGIMKIPLSYVVCASFVPDSVG